MRKNPYLIKALEELTESTMADVSPIAEVEIQGDKIDEGGPEQVDSVEILQTNEAALEAELADAEMAELQTTNELTEKELTEAVGAAAALEGLATKYGLAAKASNHDMHVLSAYATAIETISQPYGGVMGHPALEALADKPVNPSTVTDGTYREAGAKSLITATTDRVKKIYAAVIKFIKESFSRISEFVTNVLVSVNRNMAELKSLVETVKSSKAAVGKTYVNDKLGAALGMIRGNGEYPNQVLDFTDNISVFLNTHVPVAAEYIERSIAAINTKGGEQTTFSDTGEKHIASLFSKFFNFDVKEQGPLRQGTTTSLLGNARMQLIAQYDATLKSSSYATVSAIAAPDVDENPKLVIPAIDEVVSMYASLNAFSNSTDLKKTVSKIKDVQKSFGSLGADSGERIDSSALSVLRLMSSMVTSGVPVYLKHYAKVVRSTVAFVKLTHGSAAEQRQ